ncbi:hypothetical protein [Azoarcus sp. KH32C]|uniref:hypothetical protein n=1 Tax=Azoarcus sp. KH32C TaxID=748247 RepID=UPI0002386CB1|nr:hypothetical protein [Azoarcus sp. KH32C]BAL25456.1 hypothetical protein AZKH_3164 [Azoarcus sp. KH32C]
MTQPLADLLPGGAGGGGVRVWLKSADYTLRLLGNGGDPWAGAAQYLAYFSQAHGLLRPDVAVVEVGGLYDSWLVRHPELKAELGAKRRLAWPLRKWLEAEPPRAILAEVLAAVVAHLRGQVPLVLAMPSPRHWLYRANVLAGREDVELDGDGIEDAAMYVADVLRSVSHLDVAGLLFEERDDDARFGPLEVERYRPVLNVARHYRWSVALRLGDAPLAAQPAIEDVQALIGPAAAIHGADVATGLDVSEALWAGQEIPARGARQFWFAEIPREQKPESVLENLARLRAQA